MTALRRLVHTLIAAIGYRLVHASRPAASLEHARVPVSAVPTEVRT
jgi:hypothetical protein